VSDAKCEPCEGTGYAPNCVPGDRERGDLWACSYCNGSGFTDFADGDEQAEGEDFTEDE